MTPPTSLVHRVRNACALLLHKTLPAQCYLCRGTLTQEAFSLPAFPFLCSDCHACLPILSEHPTCQRCDEPLALTAPFCAHCLKQPPAFDQVLCAYRYEAYVKNVIALFKNQQQYALARFMCSTLIQRIEKHYKGNRPSLLIPTPTHWQTRFQRGFNPSELLAHELSSALKIPVNLALKKTQKTSTQKSLSRKARLENLKHSAIATTHLNGAHVALIDDVVTTTATAQTFSKLLKQHGAKTVDVWALARTPPLR